MPTVDTFGANTLAIDLGWQDSATRDRTADWRESLNLSSDDDGIRVVHWMQQGRVIKTERAHVFSLHLIGSKEKALAASMQIWVDEHGRISDDLITARPPAPPKRPFLPKMVKNQPLADAEKLKAPFLKAFKRYGIATHACREVGLADSWLPRFCNPKHKSYDADFEQKWLWLKANHAVPLYRQFER